MYDVLFAVLSGLVSKVFESSAQLDPEALHYLLDALRKLSNEAMELAYSNRVSTLLNYMIVIDSETICIAPMCHLIPLTVVKSF